VTREKRENDGLTDRVGWKGWPELEKNLGKEEKRVVCTWKLKK